MPNRTTEKLFCLPDAKYVLSVSGTVLEISAEQNCVGLKDYGPKQISSDLFDNWSDTENSFAYG